MRAVLAGRRRQGLGRHRGTGKDTPSHQIALAETPLHEQSADQRQAESSGMSTWACS